MDALRNFFPRKTTSPLTVFASGESNNQHALPAMGRDDEPLTIIELFQSQGCSSCPPTETNLRALIPQTPNLLLLTYDVTYWDHLGWTDTFGNKLWDHRQRAYSSKWGRRSVFTPQVVVDGITDGVGNRKNEVVEIVARAQRERLGLGTRVELFVQGRELMIRDKAGEAGTYDVLLVTFDPREQSVEIKRGENKGRTLAHWNLVKEIRKIGEWRGGNVRVGLPESLEGGLEKVVILQAGVGGAISAAHRV
ncbi:DUF1223-domain-containing protein [Stipitochalara longipes BDJ]|nr:DUF1223-domain-containing protein [Stipitochalara longipes BDJ]